MSTPAHIKTPDDTGNTGKKVRTQTRVVGSDTVHEHFVVTAYKEDILGMYYGSTPITQIVQSAHAANAGFYYLFNPLASGVTMALRRMAYLGAPTTTSARPTTLLTAERFTFTGTHSGAAIATGKRDSGDAAAAGIFADNKTGLTVTQVGATHRGFLIPAVPSGNNVAGGSNELVWTPNGDEGETIIAPGEGLMVRQASAGSAGDDRDFIINLAWLEF